MHSNYYKLESYLIKKTTNRVNFAGSRHFHLIHKLYGYIIMTFS